MGRNQKQEQGYTLTPWLGMSSGLGWDVLKNQFQGGLSAVYRHPTLARVTRIPLILLLETRIEEASRGLSDPPPLGSSFGCLVAILALGAFVARAIRRTHFNRHRLA